MATMEPSNGTPRHLSQKDEDLYSQKNLNVNVYGSLIHYSPELETTHMSFKGLNKL